MTSDNLDISMSELIRAKRAVIALAEVSKTAFKVTETTPSVELNEDLLILSKILRKIEVVAT